MIFKHEEQESKGQKMKIFMSKLLAVIFVFNSIACSHAQTKLASAVDQDYLDSSSHASLDVQKVTKLSQNRFEVLTSDGQSIGIIPLKKNNILVYGLTDDSIICEVPEGFSNSNQLSVENVNCVESSGENQELIAGWLILLIFYAVIAIGECMRESNYGEGACADLRS